ncbi:DUF4352 domain-containing protein [Peribacillus frigoritolerans]|uniref:DUF4352 domain-containing protein n=1 Tax=Peribacillus frigoritolerans TaxID=450367 RepID=UPI003870F2F8
MKKFAKILGLSALTIGVLTACGESEVKEVDGGAKEETKKEEAPKKESYKVGDTVSVDGMEVTIKSAKFVNPAEYSPSEKGKIIQIEVTAKNNSSANGFIDNTEFTISDKEGNMLEEYYGFDTSFSGEVKKGKQLSGKIAFDVSESESYEIFYEPSFTLKENAEIKFDLPKSELE